MTKSNSLSSYVAFRAYVYPTLPYVCYSLQVPPVVLEWDELNCHWTSKKKKGSKDKDDSSSSSTGTKQILHSLTGEAQPGRYGSSCVAQLTPCSFTRQSNAAGCWLEGGLMHCVEQPCVIRRSNAISEVDSWCTQHVAAAAAGSV